MTNLKNKITKALKNEKHANKVMQDLTKIQKNLIKNYSNPVFSKSDKNKLLTKNNEIENIEKAIYRHKTLNQNGFSSEIEEGTVLKGGISNVRYIWHAEGEDPCEECMALDGTEYGLEDEIPERPHPNCQCTVEIVEYNDENDEDEEPCDCTEQIENLISELEEGTIEIDVNKDKTDKKKKLSKKTSENESNNYKKFKNNSVKNDLQEIGTTLSAGAELSDFIKRLGQYAKINEKAIKKALYDYKSSIGRNLKNKYQDKIYVEVDKFTKEAAKSTKNVKIAGKIAAKVAPVLTYAYILEETLKGYEEGGIPESIKNIIKAAKEIVISSIIFNVMVEVFGVPIVYSASIIILIDLIKKFIFNL